MDIIIGDCEVVESGSLVFDFNKKITFKFTETKIQLSFIAADKDWVINFATIEPDLLSIVAVGCNTNTLLDRFDFSCKIGDIESKNVYFAMTFSRIKNSPNCNISYTITKEI